jgi:hypothetical protein
MSTNDEQLSSYRLLISQRQILKTLRIVAKISFALQTRVKNKKESKFFSLYDCCLRVYLQLLNQSMHTREYKSFLICVLIVLDVIEREFKTSQQYILLLLLIIKLSRYFVVRVALHDFVVDLSILTSLSFANDANDLNDTNDLNILRFLNNLRFLFVYDRKRSFALSCLKSILQRFLMRETHNSIK